MEDNYARRVNILSVYDGDTCRADIDLGYGVWFSNQSLRLYGINTPEIRGGTDETKAKGRESRDWLRARLKDADVTAKSYKGKSGKYGRYLCELFVDGVNVNEEMVHLGLAVEYMK